MTSICVFCKRAPGILIPFTSETLGRCSDVQKIREEKSLTLQDVCLPDKINTEEGYHFQCYNNFITIPSNSNQENLSAKISKEWTTCTTSSSPMPSTTTMLNISSDFMKMDVNSEQSVKKLTKKQELKQLNKFKTMCLFCKDDCGSESSEHLSQFSKEVTETIKSTATELNDICMLHYLEALTKLKILPLYHGSCKLQYRKQFLNALDEHKKDWSKVSHNHQNAFKKLCSFIKDNIIKKRNIYFLKYLENMYIDILHEQYNIDLYDLDSHIFSSKHVEKLLLQKFADQVGIALLRYKKVAIPLKQFETSNFNLEYLEAQLDTQRTAIKAKQKTLLKKDNKSKDILDSESLVDYVVASVLTNKKDSILEDCNSKFQATINSKIQDTITESAKSKSDSSHQNRKKISSKKEKNKKSNCDKARLL